MRHENYLEASLVRHKNNLKNKNPHAFILFNQIENALHFDFENGFKIHYQKRVLHIKEQKFRNNRRDIQNLSYIYNIL